MSDLVKIKECLEKVKANDVRVYHLEGISPLFDYMIVATIDVARQADAVIDYLAEALQKRPRSVEGRHGSWVLVDFNDIIIHIFTKDERGTYDLDRLYLGLPQIQYDSIK